MTNFEWRSLLSVPYFTSLGVYRGKHRDNSHAALEVCVDADYEALRNSQCPCKRHRARHSRFTAKVRAK